MSVLKQLNDPALQKYYEALFVLFSLPGWQMLMEDNGRMLETHDRLTGVSTVEELYFRKGQVNQMEWMRDLQAATEHAYKSILEEQEGADVAGGNDTTGGRATIVEPERQ